MKTAVLGEQQPKVRRLDEVIWESLKELGYGG